MVASLDKPCLAEGRRMSRSPRPARTHVAPRVFALGVLTAFVAWLGVLAHLAGTLHFALISHEICAAHGELVHRASATAAEHGRASGPAAAPSSAGEEHDHCPVAGRRHEQVALGEAPAVHVAPAPRVLTPVVGASAGVVPSRDALLLTAPKQSPPA